MDIYKCLALIADQMQVKFTLNQKPIAALEVFGPKGLFPSFMRRADQLSNFCLGKGLGVTFENTTNTLLGITAKMDGSTSMAFRIMCITEILCELMESSLNPRLVALDNLMYD
jgi:intracellular multiplication protein IcmS